MLDRLRLDADRIEGIAASIESIADLPDPVGDVIGTIERPNGMTLRRVRIPIGVIGIIYESRPNVTADAAALCMKRSEEHTSELQPLMRITYAAFCLKTQNTQSHTRL